MILHTVLLASLASVSIGSNAIEQPTPPPPSGEAVFQSSVRHYVQQLHDAGEFSGVVRIDTDGKKPFVLAVGISNRATGSRVTSSTQFNIASIGKLFTEIAILQLVEKGELRLDDTVGHWLPNYPNAEVRAKVTVAQLLSMRSGIGDFFGPKFDSADHAKIKTLQDYVPFFADQPLAFEPGSSEMYSNGGFLVLGLIIERVSGESYYDYVQRNIFDKVGMPHTGYPTLDAASGTLARGYIRTAHGLQDAHDMQPGRGSSAGGAFSTAADLAALLRALRPGKIFRRRDLARFKKAEIR